MMPLSIPEVEMKKEIKEEIRDGFSTEDQRAFEIVQNLPIPMQLSTAKFGNKTEKSQNLPTPKMPCSSVKNISNFKGTI